MSQIYNFSAGPAMLPTQVIKKMQDELLEYGNAIC
jgi:phosphoserine aminotransferase